MSKDCWDKTEIVGKFFGAVLIPIVVAFSVHSLNSEASQRATAAQMAGIAVGILAEEPTADKGSPSALRDWAISVLRNPGEITPLSVNAAEQLRTEGFPYVVWDLMTQAGSKVIIDKSDLFNEAE